MDMLTTSFLLFVGVFALRGAMLGFINLFARIISLICGYIAAYAFRLDVAELLLEQMDHGSLYVAQVIASVGLFFVTTLVVGLLIKLLVKLLRKMNATLDALLAGKSVHGRVFGALINGGIGAFIFLIGLWGYGYVAGLAGLPAVPHGASQLQDAANKVGDTTFNFLLAASKSDKPDAVIEKVREQKPDAKEIYQRSTEALDNAQGMNLEQQLRQPGASGSAVIVSSSNPDKVYRVEANGGFEELPVRQVEEIVEPQTLLENPVVQEQLLPKLEQALNNPELIKQALQEKAPMLAELIDSGAVTLDDPNPEATQQMMDRVKQLLSDPEALKEALSDPRVQQIMEQAAEQQNAK